MARPEASAAAVTKATGHDWDHWFGVVDGLGPLPDHTARAAKLSETHPEVSGWWVQTIIVEYERARGLRVHGQTSTGDFQVACSKTLYMDGAEAWNRLVEIPFLGPVDWTEGVEQDVDGGRILVRRADPEKMLRWFWFDDDGKSTVEVQFTNKGDRTVLNFRHFGFASKQQSAAYRARWKQALQAIEQGEI